MGLQAILSDPFRIGEIGLHRVDPGCTQFCCFFDDKISTSLFDWCKIQPNIGRGFLVFGLLQTDQHRATFSHFDQFCLPFTVTPVKQSHFRTRFLTHHTCYVMRLLFG